MSIYCGKQIEKDENDLRSPPAGLDGNEIANSLEMARHFVVPPRENPQQKKPLAALAAKRSQQEAAQQRGLSVFPAPPLHRGFLVKNMGFP